MKKSSKIILVLIIVLLLIAMGVGGYFIVKISNDSNEKISSLESEINSLKSEKEDSNVQNKNEVKSDTKENNESVSKNENNSNQKSETEIANEAIKNALKDKTWIKNNVIPESDREYYEEVNQKLTFICLKKENDGTPMIIVQYDAIGNTGTMSCALISYNKGKLDTQVIDPGMARMICVDPNNRTMCITINDGGNPAFEYYKVENKIASVTDKIKQSGKEDCKFFKGILNSYEYEEITEEEYESIVRKYEENNMVTIETELNENNIDKYVK